MTELHVKIIAQSYQDLKKLFERKNLDIFYQTAEKNNKNKYSIKALLSKNQVNPLKKEGYQIVILKDYTKIPDPRSQVSQINRFLNEDKRKKKLTGD